MLSSDGRLEGQEQIETINCDQATNSCLVKVPAPSVALVFLTDNSMNAAQGSTMTFSTTAVTKLSNTATVDSAVLATSNGHGGTARTGKLWSTSRGSANDALSLRNAVPGFTASLGLVIAAFTFRLAWMP